MEVGERVPSRSSKRRETCRLPRSAWPSATPVLHRAGQAPVRPGGLGAPGCTHLQLEGRHGRLRAARRRVPGHVVAERHQHRRPEVLPWHPGHRPSGRLRCARSSTASPTRSPSGAWRAGTSPATAETEAFRDELKYILVTQRAAFNSPVWFNIGVKGVPQQASACFILAVEDTMDGILNWYKEEGVIFKGGSGSGINLSNIRSSYELLNGGGTASGPVSFMRGADASAGTIKSGGKTRRAAKMVILDIDHPDVEEFIWCKVRRAQGPRAARRRLRHGPRRQGLVLDPVPERQQLRAGHRRVHGGGERRFRLVPEGVLHRRHHRNGSGA